jgi:hypothetical protein
MFSSASIFLAVTVFLTIAVQLNNAFAILPCQASKVTRHSIQCMVKAKDTDESSSGKGFGIKPNEQEPEPLDAPRIIKPAKGTAKVSIDKFLMMYTCKLCLERNAQMVSKVAYSQGMVLSTCRNCKNVHLIADNEKKLDMGDPHDQKVEDLLEKMGEVVQKMTINASDLAENYLVDKDGQLTLQPKSAGQPRGAGTSIVDYPEEFIPLATPPSAPE